MKLVAFLPILPKSRASAAITQHAKLVSNIDKDITELGTSSIVNYSLPLVAGLIDSICIGKFGSVSQLSGEALGDQAFLFFFSIGSFISIIMTQLVVECKTAADVSIISYVAYIFSGILGALLSIINIVYSKGILAQFVSGNSEIFRYASEYFVNRMPFLAIAFFNSCSYGILRAQYDLKSVIIINGKSEILSLIANPIVMYTAGIKGIAWSNNLIDLYRFFEYQRIVRLKKILCKFPSIKQIVPKFAKIIKYGGLLQIKGMCGNICGTMLNKKAISFDKDGISSSAFLLSNKFLHLGMVVYFSLSAIIGIIKQKYINNGKEVDRAFVKWEIKSHLFQIIYWAFVYGIFLPMSTNKLQIINTVRSYFVPAIIFQCVTGMSLIVEGNWIAQKRFGLIGLNSLFSIVTIKALIGKCNSIPHLYYLAAGSQAAKVIFRFFG